MAKISDELDLFPVMQMKSWAKANGINSSKDRTLNSLSIISLVAFHLQVKLGLYAETSFYMLITLNSSVDVSATINP